MFKVINKKPEPRHWRRSGVFIVNFEHILHHFLVFLLFEFEQVVARESCATENYRQIFAASVKGQLLKASNIKWWKYGKIVLLFFAMKNTHGYLLRSHKDCFRSP